MAADCPGVISDHENHRRPPPQAHELEMKPSRDHDEDKEEATGRWRTSHSTSFIGPSVGDAMGDARTVARPRTQEACASRPERRATEPRRDASSRSSAPQRFEYQVSRFESLWPLGHPTPDRTHYRY